MFTLTFWKAALERALSTAAQSALLAVGADQFNVIGADFATIAGFAGGGFLLSALKSVVVAGATDGNPSVGSVEALPGHDYTG